MLRKVDLLLLSATNFSFVARITTEASTFLATSLNPTLVIGCQQSAASRHIKKKHGDGEDELEVVEVDQKLSKSQKFTLYKDPEGYRIL